MPSLYPSALRLSSWPRPTLRNVTPVLLLPAGIGLLFKVAIAPTAALKILAIALAIFCPELTRMAWVDLKNVEAISAAPAFSETAFSETAFSATLLLENSSSKAIDPPEKTAVEIVMPEKMQQLKQFRIVVVSTIVLEATGFYLALVSLPLGALAIISSQIWFNLLAKVQLNPTQPMPIVTCGVRDRKVILTVNTVTTALLCCWPVQSMRLGLAIALLALTTLFLVVKYGFLKPE